jgi:hypothetical protein
MVVLPHLRRALAVALALASLSVPALAGAGPRQTDPFKRDVDKKKDVAPAPKEAVVEPPALEERAARCRAAAPAGESVESRPCMYLVRELTLSGVSRSESGVEAFVFAAPTRQILLVREGDALFDGRVVAVREPGPAGGAQVVLERTIEKRVGKKPVKRVESVTLDISAPPAGR